MVNTRLFEGKEYQLIIYNGQAVLNMPFCFVEVDQCSGEESDFDFPGYFSSYFRVYNERSGRLIKDLQLSHSGSTLFLNASVLDMTFEDNGNYYYEIGYVNSIYEQALRYGTLKVI